MPEKETFRWGRKSRAEGAEPTTSEEIAALQAQIADKQNELAQLQARAAEIEQQHRDSRDERWGVNDITVPNEGEMTYQEYLEQRPLSDEEKAYAEHLEQNPAEGRTKAGYEQYREENNLSAIDDSQNSAEEHYASIGELENKGEYQQPELENMNLVQLSREAAKAIALGDRAQEENVREAVKKYLESSYDADSSDAGRERHMKEDYDKFWERVGKLTSEPKEQEKSRWEKIKAGFKFERDMLRKYGAMAYFSEKWGRVMRGLKDHTLDHGITEEMSDEEMYELLSTDGMLVKRPILVTGECVLVGFKENEWKEALLINK